MVIQPWSEDFSPPPLLINSGESGVVACRTFFFIPFVVPFPQVISLLCDRGRHLPPARPSLVFPCVLPPDFLLPEPGWESSGPDLVSDSLVPMFSYLFYLFPFFFFVERVTHSLSFFP